MIYLHMPNGRLVSALGRVAVRHTQLDYALRLTVKSLANLRLNEGLDATERVGSAALREQIDKLAKKRFGVTKPYLQLRAIMTRCENATTKRNEALHGLFAKELDGQQVFRHRGREFKKPPTPKELMNLAEELHRLGEEITRERLDGWLKQALKDTEAKRPREGDRRDVGIEVDRVGADGRRSGIERPIGAEVAVNRS